MSTPNLRRGVKLMHTGASVCALKFAVFAWQT